MTRESRPHREVECSVNTRQRRIEAVERGKDSAPDEHAPGRDPELVGLDIVLRLIEFAVDEGDRSPERGERLPEARDDIGLVEPHQLRAGDGH